MSKKLEDMSPYELRAYADKLEHQKKLESIPTEQTKIDLNHLIFYCEDSFKKMVDGDFYDDDHADFKDKVAEMALEAIYGKDIFKWINQH